MRVCRILSVAITGLIFPALYRLDDSKILPGNMKDNFWEMGDMGVFILFYRKSGQQT